MSNRDRSFALEYEATAGQPRRTRPTFSRILGWGISKLFFASGLAIFAEGLGDSIRGQYDSGPKEMMIGAFMAGLIIPVARLRERAER